MVYSSVWEGIHKLLQEGEVGHGNDGCLWWYAIVSLSALHGAHPLPHCAYCLVLVQNTEALSADTIHQLGRPDNCVGLISKINVYGIKILKKNT